MDDSKQDRELENNLAQCAEIMLGDNIANMHMLCSVYGFCMSVRINRLENYITWTCDTCQSVYTVRIALRERVEPTYKV